MRPPMRPPMRSLPVVYSYFDDSLPFGGGVIFSIPGVGLVSESFGVWWCDTDTSGWSCESFLTFDEAIRKLVDEADKLGRGFKSGKMRNE